MIDQKAKQRLQPVLTEFRTGIAHHRAAGATELRIKNIRLAVQQVDDLLRLAL